MFSVAFTSVALMVCEVEASDAEEAVSVAKTIAQETCGRKMSLKQAVGRCRDTYMQMNLTAREPEITEVGPAYRLHRVR